MAVGCMELLLEAHAIKHYEETRKVETVECLVEESLRTSEPRVWHAANHGLSPRHRLLLPTLIYSSRILPLHLSPFGS